MELEPNGFSVFLIWLPAALLALLTLAWGVLADRDGASTPSSPLRRWVQRASIATAVVLLTGLSLFAVVAAVHAHAEREAQQER